MSDVGSSIQGRLPKQHCEFIVPLLKFEYIQLGGYVGYDIGTIQTFDQVPITLYIFATIDFLNLNLTLDTSTAYKWKKSRCDKRDGVADSVNSQIENRIQNKLLILEAANNLMLWLSQVGIVFIFWYVLQLYILLQYV